MWRMATAERQSDAVVDVSCGEVMRLTLVLSRGLDDFRIDRQIAGHDQHAHALRMATSWMSVRSPTTTASFSSG